METSTFCVTGAATCKFFRLIAEDEDGVSTKVQEIRKGGSGAAGDKGSSSASASPDDGDYLCHAWLNSKDPSLRRVVVGTSNGNLLLYEAGEFIMVL